MLFFFIKVIAALALICFLAIFYLKFGIPLIERSRLMKQGVVYMEKPILSEINDF